MAASSPSTPSTPSTETARRARRRWPRDAPGRDRANRPWAIWGAATALWLALSGSCTWAGIAAGEEYAGFGVFGVVVGFGFCVLAGAILSLPGGGRAAGICAAILGALFVLLLMLFRPDFGVRPTTPLALLVVLAWFAGLGLGALAILSGLYRVADSKPAKPPR